MKKYNILFLCTHNSSRSVLGEALASTHYSGIFTGYSAGSAPGAAVNLSKVISKLSPLLGNLIEFNSVEFLNGKSDFQGIGKWVRQDAPDAKGNFCPRRDFGPRVEAGRRGLTAESGQPGSSGG